MEGIPPVWTNHDITLLCLGGEAERTQSLTFTPHVKLHQIKLLIVSLQNMVRMNKVLLTQWGRCSCSLTGVPFNANKDACLQD